MTSAAWALFFTVGGVFGSTTVVPNLESEIACRKQYESLQHRRIEAADAGGIYDCIQYDESTTGRDIATVLSGRK